MFTRLFALKITYMYLNCACTGKILHVTILLLVANLSAHFHFANNEFLFFVRIYKFDSIAVLLYDDLSCSFQMHSELSTVSFVTIYLTKTDVLNRWSLGKFEKGSAE